MNPFLAPGNASEAEAAEIRGLVSQAAEPEGFPDFELIFGEDSTGDPAVWIWFLVESPNSPTKRDIEALSRLRDRVETTLFERRVDRIPYIRFREASPRKG